MDILGMANIALISVSEKFKAVWERLILRGGIIFAALTSWIFNQIGYPNMVIDFIIMLMICDVATRFYVITIQTYGHFTPKTLWQTCFVDNKINSKLLKNGLFAKIFVYFILFSIANKSTVEGLAFKDGLKWLIYNGISTVELYSVMENITQVDRRFNFIKRWIIGIQKKFMNDSFKDDGTDIDKEAKSFFEEEPEKGYEELSNNINSKIENNNGDTNVIKSDEIDGSEWM